MRINTDAENISHLGELKEVFKKQGWLTNSRFFPYLAPVQCHDCKKRTCNFMTPSNILSSLMEKGFYGKETSFLKKILSPVYSIIVDFFNTPGDKTKPWKPTYCEGVNGTQYCFTPDGNVTTCLSCVGNYGYRKCGQVEIALKWINVKIVSLLFCATVVVLLTHLKATAILINLYVMI